MPGLIRNVGVMLLAAGLLACDPAEDTASPPADGDTEPTRAAASPAVSELAGRIELIAHSCAACHGADGRLHTDIPAIAGASEAVLTAQLLAFKRDETPHATVMPRLAKGFTEEELREVAAWFAALDEPTAP